MTDLVKFANTLLAAPMVAREKAQQHVSEIHSPDCECDGDYVDGEMVQIVCKACKAAREKFMEGQQ